MSGLMTFAVHFWAKWAGGLPDWPNRNLTPRSSWLTRMRGCGSALFPWEAPQRFRDWLDR